MEGSLKNCEILRRELDSDEESAGYCCKTAYTIPVDSLPPENAF